MKQKRERDSQVLQIFKLTDIVKITIIILVKKINKKI